MRLDEGIPETLGDGSRIRSRLVIDKIAKRIQSAAAWPALVISDAPSLIERQEIFQPDERDIDSRLDGVAVGGMAYLVLNLPDGLVVGLREIAVNSDRRNIQIVAELYPGNVREGARKCLRRRLEAEHHAVARHAQFV